MGEPRKKGKIRKLPKTVLLLGAVSLANDIASEMVMPLLPVFLTSVLGAGPAALGLIEGVAEATSSLLKMVSGIWADRSGRFKELVGTGYTISNSARPFIALAGSWPAVLFLRFTDRVGKGLRTAPRDSIIAGAVPSGTRGAAFGFHRAMDHAGASLGPLLAAGLLWAGWSLSDVILVSAVPGVLVLVLLLTALRTVSSVTTGGTRPQLRSALKGQTRSVILTTGMASFAAIPDLLLIFWAHSLGLSAVAIPLLWMVAHLGRMVVTAYAGSVSDRRGRFRMTILGWVLRIILLVVLILLPHREGFVWLGFILYTGSTAWTESVERAWIADLAPADLRASLLGGYHMIAGMAALPGAVVLGTAWEFWGADVAFTVSAGLLTVATVSLWLSVPKENEIEQGQSL